jgi:hypothetical protein
LSPAGKSIVHTKLEQTKKSIPKVSVDSMKFPPQKKENKNDEIHTINGNEGRFIE